MPTLCRAGIFLDTDEFGTLHIRLTMPRYNTAKGGIGNPSMGARPMIGCGRVCQKLVEPGVSSLTEAHVHTQHECNNESSLRTCYPHAQCSVVRWKCICNASYWEDRIMKPLALDTPLHVEQRWIAGLRARGALWRLQRLVDMTHFCWHAAYDAFQRARPEATPREREAWLLQERYGHAIAQRIMALRHIQGLDREVHYDHPE